MSEELYVEYGVASIQKKFMNIPPMSGVPVLAIYLNRDAPKLKAFEIMEQMFVLNMDCQKDRYHVMILGERNEEPMQQDLSQLIEFLLDRGIEITIVTKGTFFIPNISYSSFFLTIICRPEEGVPVHTELLNKVDFYEYIVNKKQELNEYGLPVSMTLPTPDSTCGIILTPKKEKKAVESRENRRLVNELCFKFGYYRGTQEGIVSYENVSY